MILHKSLNHAAKHTKKNHYSKFNREEMGRTFLEVFEVLEENTSIH